VKFLQTAGAGLLPLGLLLVVGCASAGLSAGRTLDDASIRAQVIARLTANARVNPFEVDVQVSEGVVHLAGVVDDGGTRKAADAEAHAVPGVRGVIDDLKIGDASAGRMLDDAAVTARVKAKLTASAELNPFVVEVSTAQGVVSLMGRVRTPADRDEAERIARATSGVTGVRNLLAVGPPPP
jgi:hyperosmotically inducible protein